MGKPVLEPKEPALSRFSVSSFDRPARQHPDQMRAIFGATMQVAVQPFRGYVDSRQHLWREALLQGLLESGDTEHAVRAGAGDGDADVRRPPGHEHPDQRVARGLVAELDV